MPGIYLIEIGVPNQITLQSRLLRGLILGSPLLVLTQLSQGQRQKHLPTTVLKVLPGSWARYKAA